MTTEDTGETILIAIETIAATSSKKEKEGLIKAAGSVSELFMRVISYAYDPFKTYGVRDVLPHGGRAGHTDLMHFGVWNMLDDLISRKLSGDAARTAIHDMMRTLNKPSAELFRRIINKDMRAGFTDGTVNRVFKGTLPEFPYMRCSLPAKSNMPNWDWSVGIIVQEKADGSFANVNRDLDNGLWITTRQGSPYPTGIFGDLEEDMLIALTARTQSHGELVVYENGVLMPRAEGNGVLNACQSGRPLEPNQKVVFEAWDQIPLDMVVPKGKYKVGYKARLAGLARQIMAGNRNGAVGVKVIPTRLVKSKALAYAYYRELLKLGKEGVVCKHPDAIWADNTSKDQVKLKLDFNVELRIKKMIPGTPGTKTEATFGSLLCESECGKLATGVSGYTDAQRLMIFNDWPRFENGIMTVKANDIMEPDDTEELYSLFLPRVVEIREDKVTADTLEQIRDQKQAAMDAA